MRGQINWETSGSFLLQEYWQYNALFAFTLIPIFYCTLKIVGCIYHNISGDPFIGLRKLIECTRKTKYFSSIWKWWTAGQKRQKRPKFYFLITIWRRKSYLFSPTNRMKIFLGHNKTFCRKTFTQTRLSLLLLSVIIIMLINKTRYRDRDVFWTSKFANRIHRDLKCVRNWTPLIFNYISLPLEVWQGVWRDGPRPNSEFRGQNSANHLWFNCTQS